MKKIALCAALVLGCGPALAEKADKQKPINLEADNLKNDEAKKLTVVEGRVVLTKGTILLRANRLEVRNEAGDAQYLLATAKPNERVFFRQKREGLDEFMEGEAERIEYDSKLDVVRLVGRAVMRRLRGATLADEAVGHSIIFNNQTETLSINGAAPDAKSTDRVRMMLSPKP
jgi:lipopolysaccharide export system protein LptA